jgi:5-methyltetrahydropteroyltriglutamate--homocysteine methyltransferase
MKRSTDRILTTHGGALKRPHDLAELVAAKDQGQSVDDAVLNARIASATRDVVAAQLKSGIDIVNDGEFPKISWMGYYHDRLKGIERRPASAHSPGARLVGRDSEKFPGWYALAARMGGPFYSPMLRLDDKGPAFGSVTEIGVCAAPLAYGDGSQVRFDIQNLKTAADGQRPTDLFISAIGPSMLEWALPNAFYKTEEEYVFAVAEAMRSEYRAIANAGIVVQIDEPTFATNWTLNPWAMRSLDEYRRWLAMRVDAMNLALKDVPADMVRVHFCWGSWHAPHAGDIPLRDIIDLIVKVNAGAFSFEASNPRHDHEWEAWKDVKLREGTILVPGVIGHYSDYIEHPELVAQRVRRFAGIVGRENVIAGTDCGIGSRVGHEEICWAKFNAMAEGARLASKQLWAR